MSVHQVFELSIDMFTGPRHDSDGDTLSINRQQERTQIRDFTLK